MADQPTSNDMFDWMKMWNPMSFPMPGMGLPTVNLDEINKKITELKAVEAWLTMSTGMVQMTVKTLEMQKAALEGIKSAGDQMSAAQKKPGG
ncbi:MAG: PhaM family polyhydroxyalkanoate granule multifunctional regulatory protein [Hypericibacter sp.]